VTALPADLRRKIRSLAEAPWFVELHDKILSERLIRHKGIGAEILSTVAEAWRLQHEAWVVQHTSLCEPVRELKKADGDPGRNSGAATVSYPLSL
jgi:hypothetical protein